MISPNFINSVFGIRYSVLMEVFDVFFLNLLFLWGFDDVVVFSRICVSVVYMVTVFAFVCMLIFQV